MGKLGLYSPAVRGVKSYYEVVDQAVEHGLPAVECLNVMEFKEPDEEAALRLKEYADKKGIVISCFSVFVQKASENVGLLKRYARLAKILGAPFFHHTIVGECRFSKRVLPQKDVLFEEGILAVREIYDYCRSLGIKAVYEEQGYIFNGVEDFGRFLKEVDREVGVVADFGNIYESKDGLPEFLEAFSHRVVHVHIKDVFLLEENADGAGMDSLSGKFFYEAVPGQGIVDIQGAVAALKKAGYQGYYSMEYSAPQEHPERIVKVLDWLKEIL